MAEYELGNRVWHDIWGYGTVVELHTTQLESIVVYFNNKSSTRAVRIGSLKQKELHKKDSDINKAFEMMKPLRDHVESIDCDNNCPKCPLRYGSSTCIAAIINNLFECRYD